MKYLLVVVISALAALSLARTRSYAVDTPMTRMLVYPAGYTDGGEVEPADFTGVVPSAVAATVRVVAKVRDDWGQPGLSTGSGAIISTDGYIVTNYHVVRGSEGVTVTLNNHRALKATIAGTDATADLAVLKIDAAHLPFFTYGNSEELKVGQWVLAIGYPLGLESTVTAGIVSAKGGNYIQTDAAVNLGNSGGPLIDRNGRLMGINAALTTSTGSYVGYSFAIPAHTVKNVVNRLLGLGEPTVTH
ncbi:MAG TPA: trypsin-like peptidase domain-containing protein [Puia sp.]|jgi:S1-C subfamily serine protease